VNVQVPDGFPRAGTYPLVVNYRGLVSAPYSLQINPAQPGVLAPAAFKVENRQYLAAVHASNGALVSNGQIAGVARAPAAPGETLLIFGTGFGTVANTQAIAGTVNNRTAPFDHSLEIAIGGVPAEVPYAGLAPGLVGVGQINVVVPDGLPTGDHAVVIRFDGATLPQNNLLLPVQRN
jgi:uncharacterized protein (TIGR03437 family)